MKEHLNVDTIKTSFPSVITRRMVLSQVEKIFDPLGLLVPFVLRAKILLRKTCNKDVTEDGALGWDEPLPFHLYKEWKMFFIKLFTVENISFPRCIQPKMSIGDPILLIC